MPSGKPDASGGPERSGAAGPSDYRAGWQTADAPQAYEDDLAREGWIGGGWLERREQELLFDVVDRRLAGRSVRHLDFACGTGRIAAALRDRAATTTGVDTSAEMLEVARRRVPDAEFVLGDITENASVVQGSFDLITAFRFALNAGPSLRGDAFAALHGALADDGVLVFNVHSNAWSVRAVSVGVRKHVLRQRWWNQLSYRVVRKELRTHGFEIAELHGYNYLSSKGYLPFRAEAALRVERSLSHVGPLRYVAVDQMYVCRRS